MLRHGKAMVILTSLCSLFLIIFFMSGCAGTGGFQEVKFKNENYKDIKIYGMFDQDFASKNFGGFRFIFENTRDQWSTIKNIRVSFTEDSAKKYIKTLDPGRLHLWGKAILQQQHIKDSDFTQLQSALISAG
jgi:hypothetical protein